MTRPPAIAPVPLVIAAVPALLAACSFATAAATRPALEDRPADDAGWQTHALVGDGDVRVRLKMKRRATPADEGFLRLEFENAGDAPVRVTSAGYRLDRRTSSLATGRGVDTGGLAGGSTHELFPQAWKASRDTSIVLAPRTTHVQSDQPSEYAAALLDMPPEGGLRVAVDAHLTLELADGRTLSHDPGVPPAFEWHPPDEAGVRAMQARLKALAARPPRRYTEVYVLSMLLRVPAVAGVLTAEEAAAGLRCRTGSGDVAGGRDHLARFINRAHPRHPKVIDYYTAALRDRDYDWVAAADLAHDAPDVWSASLLGPLVDLAARTRDAGTLRSALTALNHHAPAWREDAAVSRRLSAAVRAAVPFPAGDPAALNEDQRESLLRTVDLLGMTRDRGVLPLLRPLLDSDVVLSDPNNRQAARVVRSLGPYPPLRARDAAAAAILKLLWRDDDARALFTDAGPEAAAPAEGSVADQLAARDRRIAALRDELAKP